jgi:hypothetical protein
MCIAPVAGGCDDEVDIEYLRRPGLFPLYWGDGKSQGISTVASVSRRDSVAAVDAVWPAGFVGAEISALVVHALVYGLDEL